MAGVVLHQLTKTYTDASGRVAHAVKGIDLEIADGEFMVLVGPSGCGKSTTLRMVAGLEEISGGTVAIDGRVVNDALPKDRDIAMVFQNYALYPHMTVYQNMAFGLMLRKLPKPEVDRRVREAAQLLGLVDYLERKPKALSGGQRQRVAVGRAIVRHPKVFLFDEPLSNLDAKMRGAMRGELARLHARLGATMIYVTHDQVEAMTMGDRICVMRDGCILQTATPLDLYNRPANLFVAGFIGSPPMNFFAGTLQPDGGNVRFIESENSARPVALTLPDALAHRAASRVGRSVVLGVRPEHFSVAEAEAGSAAVASIVANVELTELMGAETIVHLHTGRTGFLARLRPTDLPAPGETLTVAVDLAQAHLFDPETEQALA